MRDNVGLVLFLVGNILFVVMSLSFVFLLGITWMSVVAAFNAFVVGYLACTIQMTN